MKPERGATRRAAIPGAAQRINHMDSVSRSTAHLRRRGMAMTMVKLRAESEIHRCSRKPEPLRERLIFPSVAARRLARSVSSFRDCSESAKSRDAAALDRQLRCPCQRVAARGRIHVGPAADHPVPVDSVVVGS